MFHERFRLIRWGLVGGEKTPLEWWNEHPNHPAFAEREKTSQTLDLRQG